MPFTRCGPSTAVTVTEIDDFIPQETYETLGDCLGENYGVLPYVTQSVGATYTAISNSPIRHSRPAFESCRWQLCTVPLRQNKCIDKYVNFIGFDRSLWAFASPLDEF